MLLGPVVANNIPLSSMLLSQRSAGLSDGDREMFVDKVCGMLRTHLTETYGWLSVCTVDESDPVGGSS